MDFLKTTDSHRFAGAIGPDRAGYDTSRDPLDSTCPPMRLHHGNSFESKPPALRAQPKSSRTGSPSLTRSENPSGPKRVCGGMPRAENSVAPKSSGETGLLRT